MVLSGCPAHYEFFHSKIQHVFKVPLVCGSLLKGNVFQDPVFCTVLLSFEQSFGCIFRTDLLRRKK